MIVPAVIFVFVYLTFAQSNARLLFDGDSCKVLDGSPGVCRSVHKCKSVYDEVVAGNLPDTVCGYDGVDTIVCCPVQGKRRVMTPTTQHPVTIRDRLPIDNRRGMISRAKCKYYSQFVHAVRHPRRGPPIRVSQCAVLRSHKLIFGGSKAERMEFPHMVAVGYNKEDGGIGWNCGGTLISENYVLTAAHCVYSINAGDASWARIGDLNLMDSVKDGATPLTIRIVDHIQHPRYVLPEQYNDIGLLRLEKEVTFNSWIRPACLHTAPKTGTTKAIATGWGHLEWTDDQGSSDLMKVTLPLVDFNTCQNFWVRGGKDKSLPRGIDKASLICAGEMGKDTCQGDSGGPLTIFSKPEYYCMYDVVGVTSLGKDCGSKFPGVYTRVYHYIPWIESIVWPRG